MAKKKTSGTKSAGEGDAASSIQHLSRPQIQKLMDAFRLWNDNAHSQYIRRVRGRYWLAFLLLRFTGARIGEILCVNDSSDIDFARNEVRIIASECSSERKQERVIPVSTEVISRIYHYQSEFPAMRGKVFTLDQGNFRRKFYKRAKEAGIPRELSYPHILRHTRAIELIEAGVPLTMVQQLLGHALSSTTAVYLQRSEVAAKEILKEKGLL
ncbi:tyrosine-type recombinase/integrase [Desulfoferrobacter suflitae]|uniref:tyrosine-type recombinase/integrase n=1 Tax=Desulfoferrobacter suflitae TaxID=2865782 RepID=UPI002164168E|nr:site-specific integrase [Desulfoferrobacter suflitae]MCK8600929.1 site-specific integrase [Desulfoferrobacter suflitae]